MAGLAAVERCLAGLRPVHAVPTAQWQGAGHPAVLACYVKFLIRVAYTVRVP